MPLLLVAILAGILCWLATWAIRSWSARAGLVDIPNERSSHVRPTSRGGGVSFVVVASTLTWWALLSSNVFVPAGFSAFTCGALLVAGVSLADDLWHLPFSVRLAAQGAGALILIFGAGWIRATAPHGVLAISLGWWGLPLTLIWLIGLTNAYNFMDGIDGLASGQAVVAAGTIAWLAMLRGADALAWAMLILASSVFGFLLHNWPPAKIFMGDVGSTFLGFTFAGWAVLSKESVFPLLAWPVVLAPFIVDTALTLISRTVRGKNWHEAHREHLYQRLVRSGWSHLAVTRLYLGIGTGLGLTIIAYYGYRLISPVLYVILVFVPLFGICAVVHIAEVHWARQLKKVNE